MANLIKNSPCGQDLFEGQPHKKLAKVIAERIRNHIGEGLIGIDGGWGTGKSNLIKLINDDLNQVTNLKNKENNYYVFTYDAWGHQNDLPKRTLLEELICYLLQDNHPLHNNVQWHEKLKNLLAKRKETTTKVIPVFGYGTLAAIILTFITIVSNCIYVTPEYEPWKYTVLLIVYIFVVGFAYYKHCQRMKEKYNQSFSLLQSLTEFVIVYQGKAKEDTMYEVLVEKEPSSNMFRKFIYDIDSELAKKNKNLVIVIDNMDRLPKENVQSLWATIHTVFSENKLSNVQVIIPFDREHIKNAFSSEDISGKNKSVAYGNDFINKSFQIVYMVPPPILTGWQEYFKLKWQEAFGIEETVDSTVIQIYDLQTKEHSPRKIIAFINEFVTIKKIADRGIEDKYIALYICGKEIITSNPLDEILNPSFLGNMNFLFSGDEKLTASLSSLHYQLPVEKANDVVFVRQFKQELDKNKPDKLLHIKENPSLLGILRHSIIEVASIPNAILALEIVLSETDKSEANKIWADIYKKALEVGQFPDKYEHYQSILLSHIESKSDYLRIIIDKYHKAIKTESSFDLALYIKGINELQQVGGVDVYGYLTKNTVPITAERFISLVEIAKKTYKNYGLVCNAEELDSHLASFEEIHRYNELTMIPHILKDYSLTKYKETIETKIKENAADGAILEYLFARLIEVADKPININQYLNETQLDNLLISLKTESNFSNEVLCMVLSQMHNKNCFTKSKSRIKTFIEDCSDEDYAEFIDTIANKILRYTTIDYLLINIDDSNFNQLLRDVIQTLYNNRVQTSKFNTLSVLKKYDVIKENSNFEGIELLECIDHYCNDLNTINKNNVDDFCVALIQDASSSELKLCKHLQTITRQYLRGLNEENWKLSISQNGVNVQIFCVYHPEQLPALNDMISNELRGYVNGEISIQPNYERLDKVLHISNELGYNVTELIEQIRDIIISKSSMNADKFKYFGRWLFEFGNLEKEGINLNRIIRSEDVQHNDVRTILIENRERLKKLLSHDNEWAKAFKLKVNSLLENNPQIKELADYLDIPAIEKEE